MIIKLSTNQIKTLYKFIDKKGKYENLSNQELNYLDTAYKRLGQTINSMTPKEQPGK